jgi:hypothetical protein
VADVAANNAVLAAFRRRRGGGKGFRDARCGGSLAIFFQQFLACEFEARALVRHIAALYQSRSFAQPLARTRTKNRS